MILRGKDVDHHNIVNDMMYSKEITYRPQGIPEEAPKDPNVLFNDSGFCLSVV